MQTPIPGTQCTVEMDVATVLTAVGAYFTDLKLAIGAKMVDVATLGDTWEAPWATLKNWTMSGGGIWHVTMDGYLFAAAGFNTTSIRIRPKGAGTGLVEFTGEVVVGAYDPLGVGVADVDKFTFTAQGHSTLTRTVQA